MTDDDDDDAEAIPSCWLPDDSGRTKKSPLLAQPKIIKVTLGKFTGVEGVTPERLSTQDSLESGAQRLAKQPSADVYPSSSSSSGVTSRKSVPQEGGGPPPFHHLHRQNPRPSEGLFAKMGKAAKKHSLDEDYLSPPPSAHPLLSERLSSEPAVTPAVASASSSSSASAASAPSSLPADAKVSSSSSVPPGSQGDGDRGGEVLRSSTSPGSGRSSLVIGIGQQLQHQTFSSSLPEDTSGEAGESSSYMQQEHRVRIQVQNSSSSSVNTATSTSTCKPGPVTKQSSVDKGE